MSENKIRAVFFNSSNSSTTEASYLSNSGNSCGDTCPPSMHPAEQPPGVSFNPVEYYAFIHLCIYYIEGVGIFCVGLIGIIINLLATRLLLRIKHRHTFHNLLLTLTIYDLMQIVFSIVCFALPQLSLSFRHNVFIYVIPFMIPLAQITLSGSSFTTVTLTIERYISLCAPYLRYTHGIKSVHYIIPVLVFSTFYNSPRFFEWRTHSEMSVRPCFDPMGMMEGGNVDQNYDGSIDYINMNSSGQLEDFPNMEDAWKYYDGEVVDGGGGLLSARNTSLHPFKMEKDEKGDTLFHQDGKTFDTFNKNYIKTNESSHQMERKEIYDYLSPEPNAMKVDPNCTEEFWNVTLVQSSLRKNPLYMTLYINWMNFLINLLLPLSVMFILNLGIYRVLKNLWAAHRTCCINHRNRQNIIATINQQGRRASLGVERFLRRVSRVNSTTNDELQTTVESILSHDTNTSPRRPTRSRLNSSSENVPMNDLRNTSVGSLTPTRAARVSVERHENSSSSITVTATCSDRDHEERERDVRYTRVSILMVVLYFVCHAPRIITNTVEMAVASDRLPIWFELLVSINHLLVVSNSSFNFLIYLWASKRNSEQANNILACPSLISWLRSLYQRLRVQWIQRRRQDLHQQKPKFTSDTNGENHNGGCSIDNNGGGRVSELIVPMIVTSSPSTPHIFENLAKQFDEEMTPPHISTTNIV